MGMFGNDQSVTTTFVAKDQMSPVVRGIRSTMDRFKRDAATGFGLAGGISVFNTAVHAFGMVTDYMGDALKAASDQAEAQSKVTVVFGEQAKAIERWASSAAQSMGLSKTAALDAAGSLGNLFDGLGIASDASLDMSKNITQLAADLGSFNNVSTDDALLALKAGLVGETEPMRKFGSALSAARVEAYALAHGMGELVMVGKRQKRVISESEKVQARYALILEDTKNAQGDFARTADGLANSQKSLDSSLEDLSVEMGKFLIGPAKDFIQFVNHVITGGRTAGGAIQEYLAEQRRLAQATQTSGDKQLGLAEALGTVLAQGDETNIMTADAAKSLMWLGKQAGQTEQDVMDLWMFYRKGGKDVAEATRLVNDFLMSTILMAAKTTAITPLLSDGWADAMGLIEESTYDATITVEEAMAGMRQAVADSMSGMFMTMDQAKDPWRTAWKEMAAWAKDPFKPAKFENYIEGRVNAALRKARQAEEDHMPGVARRWRRIATLMKDPVFKALIQIGVGVDQALADIALVKSAGQSIAGWASGFFDVFGSGGNGGGADGGVNWVPGHRNKKGRWIKGHWKGLARGGPAEAGETYIVGENGPEELVMGRNHGTVVSNGGRGGVTNVYVDGQKLFTILDGRNGRAIAMGG